MKEKKSEAEHANIMLDKRLNGENDTDSFDVDPLINNNNISLVLKNGATEDKK